MIRRKAAPPSIVKLTLAAVLFAGGAPAAETEKPPPLPPNLQPVYELALAAPPEFAADALLRLTTAPGVRNRALKRTLIEQAFQLAGQAHEPYYRMALDLGDSREAVIAAAAPFKLDALFLQSRAVEAMSRADAKAALAMFSGVPHPKLPPVPCDQVLVPLVQEYYLAAGAVAATIGDANERTRFLSAVISGMTSNVEITPAAGLVGNSEILGGAFLSRLSTLPPDPRAYRLLAPEIQSALSLFNQDAVKPYLAKQKAANCGDQKPTLDLLWQSDTAKQIFNNGRSLWIRPDGTIATDADRSTDDWARRTTDFLSTLESWTPSGESDVVFFHQKAFAYEGVLTFAPPGPIRIKVLTAYLSFLDQSNLQQQSPVEWYWHARVLVDRAPDQQARSEVMAAFRESGNVILSLEAALDALSPAGKPKFPLL
jgi:hypothetical protein